jgi:hypothetical protein
MIITNIVPNHGKKYKNIIFIKYFDIILSFFDCIFVFLIFNFHLNILFLNFILEFLIF